MLFRGKKMSVDDFLNGKFMEGSDDEVGGDEVGIQCVFILIYDTW